MKKPMRLKSGGFMSSGTDAGDLAILRTAKNIDDGSAMGMKKGGSTVKNNKDKAKQLKKFMDKKRKGKFTGKIIKPRKDYKASIVNPLRPSMQLESYDTLMENERKRELQKKRYGRERKEGEIEVKKGGLLKMKKGGKTKSRVNEAGNYTKPGLRKRIFNRIKAGGKGGRPGQWSARKAQMMAKAYKKAGGGYRG